MSKGESERELRSKPRINYSALHSHGIGRGTSPGGFTGIEFDQDVDQDVELDYGEDENASQFGDAGDELTLGGGQETSSMQPSNSITGPQKTYVSTSMEMAEEMGKLEQQMQRLDEEEALLRQSQKLQEMKKTVEEKKQKVSKLREKQLNDLKTDLEYSRRHAFAEGTNKNLRIQWESFLLFCLYFGLKYLPVDSETLALYAQFLSRSFASTQSIKNYLSGVKTMHHLLGYTTSHINDFLVNLSLRGMGRLKPHLIKQAKAITPEILISIHKFLYFSSHFDKVLWCLFLFAFFLFARKSNLVPESNNYKEKKFLTREDVTKVEDILLVHIKWSKTIQFGERVLEIPLVRIPDSVLCPVQAFENMCKAVPALPSDPLFSLPKGRCVTYYQYQNKLKYFINKIGLKPEEFSTHSMRRGGTSYAFRSKIPIPLIKSHGDWRSDSYLRHLSFSLEDKLLVASKMRESILSISQAKNT